MSSNRPPIKCADFKKILKELGFESRPRKTGTSHESWVKTEKGRFFKVTVDCPKAPFTRDLLKSMAKQAGCSVDDIYAVYRSL